MSFTSEREVGASTMDAFLRFCGQQLEFSRVFKFDLIAASAYAIATVHLYDVSAQTVPALAEIGGFAVILLLQIAKIMLVILLDRRGGDARTFKQSHVLVTDYVYGCSRNPAYLTTVMQNVMWSLLLLFGMVDGQANIEVIAVAVIVPFAHFISVDRLVIPREEADLGRWHPEAYAAYANRVDRWIGRRVA
jgi:protein-S-isoprenylcysteine O-methyltransferase Ste14